jgi:hypothetical protein
MPTSPLTTPLIRLAELEARYDGPIPTRQLNALRHGTALAADIAEARAEIAFFRGMAARARHSGKTWRDRGESVLAARAVADCRIYLAGWRARRRRLEALERTDRIDTARVRTLSAIDCLLAPLTRSSSPGDRP